jgi:glycosyltransferase involved in cell wall biosynthesis
MKPDVVHVSPRLFGAEGTWGGGERFAFELARAQAAYRPTRLVAFGKRSRRMRFERLSIHVLGSRIKSDGRFASPRPELLIAELSQARIVHCHQIENRLTELCLLVARAMRRPAFVTDLGAAAAPTLISAPTRNRLISAHLALSEYAARGYPDLVDRTTVIYAGVDPSAFVPAETQREGLVVFVGRLMPHKGIDVIIEALPQDARLEIYGRPYNPEYTSDLIEMARGKEVSFFTSATDADIIRAYQRARVSVLSSVEQTLYGGTAHKTELFGLTLVEAMSCGTPVICTSAGAMHEVVVDGRTGFVVPPGDPVAMRHCLEILLKPGQRWEAMSRAARLHVRERFTWPQVAERALAAYDVAAPPRGSPTSRG